MRLLPPAALRIPRLAFRADRFKIKPQPSLFKFSPTLHALELSCSMGAVGSTPLIPLVSLPDTHRIRTWDLPQTGSSEQRLRLYSRIFPGSFTVAFYGGVNCGEAGESGQPGYSPVAVHGRSATVNCQPPLTGLLQDNPNRRPLGRLPFTEIEFPQPQEAQMGPPANAGAAQRLLG